MESTKRTIVKALSWQTIGLVVMTIISYVHTGSLTSALSLAGTSTVLGLISYVIHEKLWQRVSWGTKISSGQRKPSNAL